MENRKGNPGKILLGTGIFQINNEPVGLTRGGGVFTVEREYRKQEADGDKGTYKGRVVQEGSIPKLELNALEIITEDITKLFPGLKIETGSIAGSNTYEITDNFEEGDVVTFFNTEFEAGEDFDVGADVSDSANNLGQALIDVGGISAIYDVTIAGAVIKITERTAGGGNTPGAMIVDGAGTIAEGAPIQSLKDGNKRITGKGKIDDIDYVDTVKWIGRTKSGKGCVITIYNAINLENINFPLAEKNDVVTKATFEGTYPEEHDTDYEPWGITWVEGE